MRSFFTSQSKNTLSREPVNTKTSYLLFAAPESNPRFSSIRRSILEAFLHRKQPFSHFGSETVDDFVMLETATDIVTDIDILCLEQSPVYAAVPGAPCIDAIRLIKLAFFP
jgi:hypothetical protein